MSKSRAVRAIHLEIVPPKILVLLALAQEGAHGYAIFDQIIADTTGHYVKKTTLYRSLSELEQQGLVMAVRSGPGKTTKRTYRLTEQGEAALQRARGLYRQIAQLVELRLR